MKTIFFRTLLSFVAALLIFLAILSAFLFLGFDRSQSTWAENKVLETHENVTRYLADPETSGVSFPQSISVFIYNTRQELIFSNRGAGRNRGFGEDGDTKKVIVDGKLLGYYHIGNLSFQNDLSNQQFITSMTRVLWIGALVSCVISAIYALFFSRSLSKPARTVAKGIRRLAEGNLEENLPESGADEIADIANAANDLRKQLLRERRLRTQWAQDVAHDLRTPISALKAQFEGIRDGVLPLNISRIEQNMGEINRVETLINDLQELMQLETPEIVHTLEPVDLSNILADLVEAFSFEAEKKGITIYQDSRSRPITIDAGLVFRAFSNVMSNAVRHTDADGTISISSRPEKNGVTVAFENTGDVIPEDELGKVFDRLFRGDRARNTPGSGLGLTIARQIVELHGGTIDISSTVGNGTFVQIWLPSGS
ncbi:MAG: HAMP domain-containing histidine kinase [Spirochaetales bacterium]|nr:HAMP domain-containing histidine kinase [Spirochaetales bacterium]